MAIKKRVIGPGRFALLDAEGMETDFSCQLTAATVAWSDETEDNVAVLCGEEEVGDVTWTATISGTMFQDRDVDGLVAWTWEHKGETFESEFVANDADGTLVRGRVSVKPLDFGGEVKTSGQSDFEWTYAGEPVIEAATS